MGKLISLMGRTEEARFWIRSLQGTSAMVNTLWGETFLPMQVGIKQGGTDSPSFFAKVVEWVFHQAGVDRQWSAFPGAFPGLDIPAVAFMDDSVLWERGVGLGKPGAHYNGKMPRVAGLYGESSTIRSHHRGGWDSNLRGARQAATMRPLKGSTGWCTGESRCWRWARSSVNLAPGA